jgi:hypothetical protein
MKVPLAAFVATLMLLSARADAQVVPFKITGGGIVEFIPSTLNTPASHFATGTATELGKYYGEGEVVLDAFLSPSTAAFSSAVPFVFTAANGDQLAFHYGRTDFGAPKPGFVELLPAGDGLVIAVWFAEFDPVYADCTGRFADLVGGSFFMIAVTEPFVFGAMDPVAYTWSGQGSLEFRKGRN